MTWYTGDTTYDTLYGRVINRFTEYAAQRCNRPSFLTATGSGGGRMRDSRAAVT